MYLTPVPPDAVVYGSGEAAVILTKVGPARRRCAAQQRSRERRREGEGGVRDHQRDGHPSACALPAGGTCDRVCVRVRLQEEAAAVQRMSLSSYGQLKQRLLLATALLTAGGSGLAAAASGVDAAIPFALGGLAGLLYLFTLQAGTDAMVASAAASAGAGTSGVRMDGFGAATAQVSRV